MNLTVLAHLNTLENRMEILKTTFSQQQQHARFPYPPLAQNMMPLKVELAKARQLMASKVGTISNHTLAEADSDDVRTLLECKYVFYLVHMPVTLLIWLVNSDNIWSVKFIHGFVR